MTISIAGSSSPFVTQLETNGLTAGKAALVAKDLSAAQATSTSTTNPTLSPATRAAFDARISADVLSGKLSASDAVAVRKTMDNQGAGSASDASQFAPTAAGTSQTGGSAETAKAAGGGGSAAKTELSETITISGSTKTTTITYTDNTTSTTTTTATDADKAKYERPKPGDQAQEAVTGYFNVIDKGALVDKSA